MRPFASIFMLKLHEYTGNRLLRNVGTCLLDCVTSHPKDYFQLPSCQCDRHCDLVVMAPGCRTEKYCFLWGTNWIYIYCLEESRPPLWSSGQSSWLLNGDLLRFLWGTNWIYICYVGESIPPLWSSGQSSWFDSRRYQIFWEVVCLEWGPLSFMSTTEELLETKSSGSGIENRECGRKDPSLWLRGTLYPQKLALTSPISGCCSVCIVRSRTQATEFSFSFIPFFPVHV
jgi:hypothetical protein